MIRYKDTIITKHFDIDQLRCIFEILMPDGRYLYYEFDPNHKLVEKLVWMITKK